MSAKIIVIKVGSSSLVDERGHPKISMLSALVETCVALHKDGIKVVIVSSGAVATGMISFGKTTKDGMSLATKQAMASVGQIQLMSTYDMLFGKVGLKVSQILLTRSDVINASRYQNACNTLKELLGMGVIPVVNENDTLSVSETKFGDNDTLSSIIALMVHADYLLLLTDVPALYTDNPKRNPKAQPLKLIKDLAELKTIKIEDSSSNVGTGGMITKIIAAKNAISGGTGCMIMCSDHVQDIPEFIKDVQNGSVDKRYLYTYFVPHHVDKSVVNVDRKFWIRTCLTRNGTLYIDNDVLQGLVCPQSSSLLLAGLHCVEGSFQDQECVSINVISSSLKEKLAVMTKKGLAHSDLLRLVLQLKESDTKPVACGIVNFNSDELIKLRGCQSSQIHQVLGYIPDYDSAIYKGNISLL
ncbi:hypothetical protein MP228_006861 [Amoeboaphelidium protococcarum]|nr:hypothetical protein MP228_006861 [Amoeboaphelidium protococcarum]